MNVVISLEIIAMYIEYDYTGILLSLAVQCDDSVILHLLCASLKISGKKKGFFIHYDILRRFQPLYFFFTVETLLKQFLVASRKSVVVFIEQLPAIRLSGSYR